MRQKGLVILNDPPYGTERSYNGLRLAGSLSRGDDADVRVFLVGDAVGCAAANQKVPEGYYHLDPMIEWVAAAGGGGPRLGVVSGRAGHGGGPARQGRSPLLARGAHLLDATDSIMRSRW